ncbi:MULTISPECIES: aldo/keto reductase [Haloferax]|jgi:aryl-alcohol dehydrogenase-like predicted oxidoreductase|uniref:Aldo/keto reductase n=4 Tax=Haloferax TaxID=2251 RepID=A0A558G789_HALVO|nr:MULTISPECIES: aldo/keto reductase [Haloferax]ELK55441.1 putative oxidoreductase [Haloferax sp. BAB-2207]ELZ76137.1 putative oxidoreductase [Haloferax lucentense DSM 14919]ELZ87139.1 putative oxidoreductase [Haloferax alexandrinus JCM 10717]MBC9987134.1 aldo/keto reductase [Haloferax sp. AS1]NLV04028.1 aldo/keto reductase [Haloferax alexandrinus]
MSLSMVPLGRTGTTVSELAFGTWRFGRQNDDGAVEVGRDRAHELLDAYAAAGGNFIDTADMYGDGASETYIGEWLAERDREEFVVASKVFWPTREDANGRGLNRKHLRRQIDRILDRLGTDYVDLLYIHRWDDETPVEEFMRTLDGFVRDGKVNYLGTSTLEPNAWKVVKANELADKRGYEPFKVAQPRYNAVNREIEGNYLDMCADYDIGIVPWSPLAGGFLTGKYARDERPPADSRAANDQRFADSYLTPANFDALEQVEEVAEAVGASPAQVSLAWLMHHPQVTAPIVGARTVDQLGENVVAADIDLTPDQFERISVAKRHLSA